MRHIIKKASNQYRTLFEIGWCAFVCIISLFPTQFPTDFVLHVCRGISMQCAFNSFVSVYFCLLHFMRTVGLKCNEQNLRLQTTTTPTETSTKSALTIKKTENKKESN